MVTMRPSEVLRSTPFGLYCPPADLYVDPVRPVARALITHGHSDHARAGHGAVLATRETLAIMELRYGAGFAQTTQIADYADPIDIGGVRFRFYPAGHVLGSAQIAVEARGLSIVVSGDYKRMPDPTCRPFEPIRCQIFITEATFGLPVFCHPDSTLEVEKLLRSVRLFPERTHLVGAYALGKTQRLIALIRLAGYDAPLFLHGALTSLTAYYAEQRIPLGLCQPVAGARREELAGAIVLCPPSALGDLWSRKFPDPVTCFASGWMRIRARARQRGVEVPLVISDHADWPALQDTIRDTGASEVWVTHGQEDALVHWCQSQGLYAQPLSMVGYGDEGESEPDAFADASS